MRIREWLAWMFCGMAIIAVIVLSLVLGLSGGHPAVVRTPDRSARKTAIQFVGDIGGPPAISPDGTSIVFSAKTEGKTQLFLRSLGKIAPQPIAGTEDAIFPFWSPDSRSIAFFADAKLKRIDLAGGAPLTICDASVGRGGSWSSNGTIVFSPTFTDALLQVPATRRNSHSSHQAFGAIHDAPLAMVPARWKTLFISGCQPRSHNKCEYRHLLGVARWQGQQASICQPIELHLRVGPPLVCS